MKKSFQKIQMLKQKFIKAFKTYHIHVLNPDEFEKRSSMIIEKKVFNITLFIKAEEQFLKNHIQKYESENIKKFTTVSNALQETAEAELKKNYELIKRYPYVDLHPNASPLLSHLIGAISLLYKQTHLIFSSWFYGTKDWPSLRLTLSRIEKFCIIENQRTPVFLKKNFNSQKNDNEKDQYLFQTISSEIYLLECTISNQYNKLKNNHHEQNNLFLKDPQKRHLLLKELEKLKDEVHSIILNFKIKA